MLKVGDEGEQTIVRSDCEVGSGELTCGDGHGLLTMAACLLFFLFVFILFELVLLCVTVLTFEEVRVIGCDEC